MPALRLPRAHASRAHLSRAHATRLRVGSPRSRPLRFSRACMRPLAAAGDYNSWLCQHPKEGKGAVDAQPGGRGGEDTEAKVRQ